MAKEVLGAGGNQAFPEWWRLSQQDPRVVVDRRRCRHPLELIDGRDYVEDAEALDGSGMVERHPVGDAASAVVADDREALESEPRHELDELCAALAVAVALTQGAAGRGATFAVALEVAHDDGVAALERRSDAVPAVVGLREPVQQQDG